MTEQDFDDIIADPKEAQNENYGGLELINERQRSPGKRRPSRRFSKRRNSRVN